MDALRQGQSDQARAHPCSRSAGQIRRSSVVDRAGHHQGLAEGALVSSQGPGGQEVSNHFGRCQLHLDIVGQMRRYLNVGDDQLAHVLSAGEE